MNEERVEKKNLNKHFDLEPEDVNILDKVKKEKGFNTEKRALQYILREFDKQRNIEQQVLHALYKYDEQRAEFMERLKWATKIAEENTTILIDCINTVLVQQKIDDCVMVDVYESPVINAARKNVKRKIERRKQIKDNNARKNRNQR